MSTIFLKILKNQLQYCSNYFYRKTSANSFSNYFSIFLYMLIIYKQIENCSLLQSKFVYNFVVFVDISFKQFRINPDNKNSYCGSNINKTKANSVKVRFVGNSNLVSNLNPSSFPFHCFNILMYINALCGIIIMHMIHFVFVNF